MLEPVLAEIRRSIQKLLTDADVPTHAVTRVVRTGGSSCIPAVCRLLEEDFPDRVVEHDPFSSVAAGLAIASHRGYRLD